MMMTLSEIAGTFAVSQNRLYALRDKLSAQGHRITDLISGNVNAQGIFFPPKILGKALRSGMRRAKTYRPDPLGQQVARQAISRFYAGENVAIPAEQIVITPGTSISYWYAFKLLANAGDEILCPSPSYPLFEAIAALSGVTLIPYPLSERDRWELDVERLRAVLTPRTKAIIVISPHNPTGAVATQEEVLKLGQIAEQNGLAIISDEVFSPFVFKLTRLPRPAMTRAPLVITLNGLSKMVALPGIKMGWMAVTGDPSNVERSLKTLEMISDTFLPVNEAAQFALPLILKESRTFRKSYAAEIKKRMMCAVEFLKGEKNISYLQPEGGFLLTVKLREGIDEEEIAYRLLQKHRILLHPGYFYDMEGQHVVLSFASRPSLLRKALQLFRQEIT